MVAKRIQLMLMLNASGRIDEVLLVIIRSGHTSVGVRATSLVITAETSKQTKIIERRTKTINEVL